MSSLNKFQAIGNVGFDPESKTFEGGSKVVTFSLATTDNWKNKEGVKQSKTEWHKIVVWGKLANIVEDWVKKGSKVYVECKVQYDQWETDSGEKRFATKMVLQNLELIGGKQESHPTPESNEPPF